MKRFTIPLSLLSLALVGYAGATAFVPRVPRPPEARFADGHSSREALVDAWLAALADNDPDALHRLRVTREEYLEILVPWTVPPGEPPRQYTEQPREFFWQLLDTRSRDWGYAMMERYGGKRFTPKEIEFTGPVKEYAGYNAFGLLRVRAENEEGEPVEVEGPFIAEVGGTYKFIGLDWTD
jgi:hypothetical protein